MGEISCGGKACPALWLSRTGCFLQEAPGPGGTAKPQEALQNLHSMGDAWLLGRWPSRVSLSGQLRTDAAWWPACPALVFLVLHAKLCEQVGIGMGAAISAALSAAGPLCGRRLWAAAEPALRTSAETIAIVLLLCSLPSPDAAEKGAVRVGRVRCPCTVLPSAFFQEVCLHVGQCLSTGL